MRKSFIIASAILALLLSACEQTAGDETAVDVNAEVPTEHDESSTPESTVGPDDEAEATTETTVAAATDDATSTTAAPTGSGDDRAAVIAAMARTGEFTSARSEGWITVIGAEGQPSGTEATMSFSASYNATTPASSMLIDWTELTDGMPGADDFPPEMRELIGEMEIRTIGDTAYFRMGLFSMFGIATEWISAPATEASGVAEGFGVNTADPRDTLGLFALADGQVEDLGREQVRGDDTTHFRISADVEALLALADPESAENLRDTTGFPRSGDLPVDLWIGDDGFVRRYAYMIDGTADPDSGFEYMELVTEIYDYGEPIEVVAPAADQVTDGEALLSLALG